MTTHSHFVIGAKTYEDVAAFACGYIHDYSLYLSRERGICRAFRSKKNAIIEINDLFYLKNCISYVLMNPVSAGMVRRAEEYEWSSFDAYFDKSPVLGRSAATMGIKETRTVFHTKYDLSESGLRVDANGRVVLRSFIAFSLVEQLFRGKIEFYRNLDRTNCTAEENRYMPPRIKYDDNELMAEAKEYMTKKFATDQIHLLTKNQKLMVVEHLRKKTRVSPARIARVMRMDPREVASLLGRE